MEWVLTGVAGLLLLVSVLLFLGLTKLPDDNLTDAQRATLRHYCPQCRQLEEDCECAMC